MFGRDGKAWLNDHRLTEAYIVSTPAYGRAVPLPGISRPERCYNYSTAHTEPSAGVECLISVVACDIFDHHRNLGGRLPLA